MSGDLWWTDRVVWKSSYRKTFSRAGPLSTKDQSKAMATNGAAPCSANWQGNERIIFNLLVIINLAPRWAVAGMLITGQPRYHRAGWTKGHRSQEWRTIFACAKPCPKPAFVAFTRLNAFSARRRNENNSARLFILTPCQQAVEDQNGYAVMLYDKENGKAEPAPMTKPSTAMSWSRLNRYADEQTNAAAYKT